MSTSAWKSLRLTAITAALALTGEVGIAKAQDITIAPDKPSGVYHVGDTVTWSINWTGQCAPPGVHYIVKSGAYTR